MKIHKIDKCRICKNNDLIKILDLGVHVLSGRFPKQEEPDPPCAPLVLVKCNDTTNKENCGLLQLGHSVSGDELYKHNYGYRSGINQTMTNHLKAIVKEAEEKLNLMPGDTVLDIGSNDATLLKSYSANGISKIGIDPTGNQFKKFYTSDIKLISDFFTIENFRKASGKKAKAITSIAMFYDLQEPMNFIRDIKEALHQEGIWVFEQSYLPDMLEANSFDTICHEHLEYYSLKQIQWLLSKNDLMIIDLDFNGTNGGSFRITAAHTNSSFKPNSSVIEEAFTKEEMFKLDTLEPYTDFSNKISVAKKQVFNFINTEIKNGKSFYIYGASTKGNTLLQYFGIDNKMIKAAAERNPEKYGRRTPLTNIPIISEEEARSKNPDYFFVLPWHFKEEFVKREQDFIKKGGKLLFPLPYFQIIGDFNNKEIR